MIWLNLAKIMGCAAPLVVGLAITALAADDAKRRKLDRADLAGVFLAWVAMLAIFCLAMHLAWEA